MASFQKTYKKIYSADASGTAGIVVDNILESGTLYFVVGYNWEYDTTGNHLFFYLRNNNADFTGAGYMRQSQTIQHGQANIIFGNNNSSTNGGTLIYCGDQPEESGGFKLTIQPRGIEGYTSYYSDGIGHVNNTGYRGQKESAYIQAHERYNGFAIRTSIGSNFASGNIDIYRIETTEYNL